MYSAYKLNKQGDNIQTCCTLSPTFNQSVFPCLFLTIVSWSAYRFHRRQMFWYFHLFKNFPVCCDHKVKGFNVVNEAEVDVFLKFSCFIYDPVDVGNLFSGSSAFSKFSLNIWKFLVHLLLMPGLENFEHYFDSVRWVQLGGILNILLALPFFETGMKLIFFLCFGHWCIFQIGWHIECNTLTASYFRIWTSSTGISSPPLAS